MNRMPGTNLVGSFVAVLLSNTPAFVEVSRVRAVGTTKGLNSKVDELLKCVPFLPLNNSRGFGNKHVVCFQATGVTTMKTVVSSTE